MGLLRVGSADFMTNLQECQAQLQIVRERFTNCIEYLLTTEGLGLLATQLNFNYFYQQAE